MSRPRPRRIVIGLVAFAAIKRLHTLAQQIRAGQFVYAQQEGRTGVVWKSIALYRRALIEGFVRATVFSGEALAVLTSPRLALRVLRVLFRPPLGTVFHNLHYGPRFRNKLDVHLPSACAPSSLRPVIVFVHGGAWSWGHKFHYSAFCDTLSRRLQAVVVNINYSVYPIGSVDEMVAEVQRSVLWAYMNAPAFHGDRANIHVMGHSAGAHLAAMAIIKPAESIHTEEVVRKVKGCIGLSGVFDVNDHYHFEASRNIGGLLKGVARISPMAPAMKCGGQDSFARQSPTVLVATPRAAALQHAALPHVPLFTLVHGEEDTTVPPSSSKKFARALQAAGLPAQLVIVPSASHVSVVLDMMLGASHGDCNALVDAFATHVARTKDTEGAKEQSFRPRTPASPHRFPRRPVRQTEEVSDEEAPNGAEEKLASAEQPHQSPGHGCAAAASVGVDSVPKQPNPVYTREQLLFPDAVLADVEGVAVVYGPGEHIGRS